MSKFPEKLFCNLYDDDSLSSYTELSDAARPTNDLPAPVRIGVYQLVEVVQAHIVESVDTVKVEN